MDNLLIIKIGGNIIDDSQKLSQFLKNFSLFKENKILVHGGGKLATDLAKQLSIPQQMIEGRRVTDAETLKVITMVYAGYINKNIVAQLQSNNCNAVGLSGADGNLIPAHKRPIKKIDYGFVGDIDNINAKWLMQLLHENITPVIAPVAHDNKGQLLNTNADTIAREIAKNLSAHFDVTLIFCFGKIGVLQNEEDESSVIPEITPSYFKELKQQQIIHSGMLPKLDNAFAALNAGVKKIVIGKAEELSKLISGTSGTVITNG